MNAFSHHDPQQPDVFSGSTQTSSFRPLLASKNSKKVCFFKSGDPQFSGHWVIINSRTFRTFDALLDALSSKVPLPFGVRTITTPKGTHSIRSLDDLRHGGSYVCSDQRKVKPLNMDEINRRHVPWNSTSPTSPGRQGRRGLIRQLVKKNEAGRMGKIVVRTPKRLVVFKNRDPSTKHIVVLQQRTASTFETLLEYLSQVMQFPVVKLYTSDGRRVEGLPALILCSGAIVAAGNEPFKLANFNLQAYSSHSQPSHSVISESTASIKTQPVPIISRPRSRNFSLSAERYFVNQINKSLKRSHSNENEVEIGSIRNVNNQALESEEMDKCYFMSGVEKKDHLIIPSDDEVEKSFRVNQDGSMTVEMKVRLTIKQEEMIHWTTTVCRACVNSQEMAASSQPVSSYNYPVKKDNNNNRTRESTIDGYESKHENTHSYKQITLNKDREHHCGCATSEALENPKPCFRRLPTPGPRRVRRKEASVKNIKSQSQTLVQKPRVGTYSHLESTAACELAEEYCVVSHSSSSSTRPVQKPKRKNLGAAKHNKTHSSLSGMSEVLQLHNNGKEITETVMHIHHSQDACENYLARTWDEVDGFKFMPKEHKRPNSTKSGPQSSSNDCKNNLTKFPVSSGSGGSSNNEHLSLVSELSQTKSTFTVYENQTRCEFSDTRVKKSTKEAPENKRVLSKTKKAHKYDGSNKHKTDKNQKGNGPNFLKKKEGQSPENRNTSHSKMLMDPSNINLRRNNMLRPQMENKIDVIPSFYSAPSKILKKQSSVNDSKKKSSKKSKELSESVSMLVLHSSPCNVHQYVENWLEINHPESVPYTDELNSHESRARFQIESEFSGISVMRNESDKYNLDRKPVSQQLVQIGCEGNLGRFSKSLPSMRMHTDKQEICTRKNKSLEDLIPKWPDARHETSPNTQLNPRSGMKQVFEQLCSPKCSSRASSHSCQSSLKFKKKSSSLPDCSLHLASVFGLSSKTLLSFLIMMTLRDEIAVFANADNSGSNPETLQVIQSIQKLASIKDEEELKASLVSLQSSVSAQLKKNWRDFQKKDDIKENPPLSPRQLEQEFAFEVNSEKDQDKGDPFHIKEVMKELNLCEEISLLVRGDLTNSDRGNPTMQHSGHENQINYSALENEEVIIKANLGEILEEKGRYFDEKASSDITNTMPAELSKDSEEIQILKSTSHKTARLGKEVAIKGSDRGEIVHITKTTNQKGLAEIVDYVRTNQERYINKELSKADFSEDKQRMDNVQMVDEKYKKQEIKLVDEIYVSDYCPSNLKTKVEWQKYVGCMQSESELLIPTSEKTNSEEINGNFSERGDCPDSFEGCGKKLKKGNNDCETTKHAEKPDISVDSETETEEDHCPNNCTIRTEKKNALNKIARSEASSFSADGTDPYSNNDNGLMAQVESNTDNDETISSTSECKNPAAKPHHSMTDQKDEQSEYYIKSASCAWQESKTELEFQKSEEERVTKKHGHNTNENDQEVDKDEDFDSETNLPLYLHQEGEYSDHSKSSNSQEALAELDLLPLDEENLNKCLINPAEEKENETHKLDNTLRNAVDTDKDLDSQSHHSYLDDPSISDFLMRESGISEDKHKAQSEDSEGKEKADMDHECHCGHPTVLPQQLLDFVNLALMSAALIFTYDVNGFLHLEPDRCKRRVMSLSKSSEDNQYSRCLPSPNTSDLSDYRPDTSDSGGNPSQVSTDLFTESGEDEAEKTFIFQGNVKQSSKNINREVKPLDNSSKKHYPKAKQIASPVPCNSSGSIGNTKLAQCLASHTKTDSEDGILIDKGRWLLKENHLIRNSPPVPMGMYDNVDTTSVDTGHTSDDAPCIPCGTQQSQLAIISSSELEDMTKPSTPKCTYFNMVHSSDSDPFLDNQSITSNKGKSKEVSPLGETARMCAKKNGSLPSFSSVEFKLAAGKVHPADGPASSGVEKSVRSQSLRCNRPHEEQSVESLSLRCGQYCPIL